MPKFQNSVRRLAASCVPERSESKPPRRALGTTGSGSAIAVAPMQAATRPIVQTRARRARSGLRIVTKTESDLDPTRSIEARRIDEPLPLFQALVQVGELAKDVLLQIGVIGHL